MPNNNYQRGAAFERKVCEQLRSCGYSAARTAGSHGVYDIVAVNPERVLFIQCKAGKGRFTNEDRNELIGHAIGHGAHPVLARKDDKGHVYLTYLVELRMPGKRGKLGDEIDLLLKGGWREFGTNSAEPAELPEVPEAAPSLTRWSRGETVPRPGAGEPA